MEFLHNMKFTKVKREKPENLPDLENLAQEKFLEMESKNSDSDFERNEKYMYFKDQLKEMKKQLQIEFFFSDLQKSFVLMSTSVLSDIHIS
ncbi:hypothetical protein DUI87_07074 [Hirundo rustica rustica]|uniref:Uncharacterized protein n=1 Tax=Hirundo rustica rustica TaxID=333673 RepID=A0A3M0L6N9_HIRRU|nr:hypothetical protein DUI87_07074 [Hirundo rustica rustica]